MDYKKVNDAFYEENCWRLDRSKNKWFSKYVKARIFKKFMKDVNKGTILDAAGGVGNWGSYFINDFQKVIVSDISQIALDQIPEKKIIKLNCNILDNPLPNESVDCILLADVFEHIEEKHLTKMLDDLKRILKPNGRIIIYSSLYGYGKGIVWQRIFHQNKRLIKNEHLDGHVNRLSFKEYKQLFSKTKLEIEDYLFYSVIFQQLTDDIKDTFAKLISFILGRKGKDAGLAGQSIKEDLRKKEKSNVLKLPLLLFSYISYLDIIFFGKKFQGNSIFFSLKKNNSLKLA